MQSIKIRAIYFPNERWTNHSERIISNEFEVNCYRYLHVSLKHICRCACRCFELNRSFEMYEKSIDRTLIVWQTYCFPVIIALCTVGTWQNVKIEITNENELRLNIESNEQMAKKSKIRRSKMNLLEYFVFFYWRLNNFSIGDFGVCLFVCVDAKP